MKIEAVWDAEYSPPHVTVDGKEKYGDPSIQFKAGNIRLGYVSRSVCKFPGPSNGRMVFYAWIVGRTQAHGYLSATAAKRAIEREAGVKKS